jgi:mono/diheme cytochrome c family protein
MDKFKSEWYNFLIISLVAVAFFQSCTTETGKKISDSDPLMKFYAGKGVGPVKDVSIYEIDTIVSAEGKNLFEGKCIACHKATDTRVVGPGLYGITKRRTPEWIMNQILNPMEMTKKDSMAKELLAVYMAQMTPMGLSEKEARKILEYFRENDKFIEN